MERSAGVKEWILIQRMEGKRRGTGKGEGEKGPEVQSFEKGIIMKKKEKKIEFLVFLDCVR